MTVMLMTQLKNVLSIYWVNYEFRIRLGGINLIMVNIILDHDKCQGSDCGVCAYVCPTNVFSIKENKNMCKFSSVL